MVNPAALALLKTSLGRTGPVPEAVEDMVEGRWKKSELPERWDGRTAERIVQILLEQ